jgi:hypothetical protein
MNANIITFILLLVTNGSRILPLAIRDSNLDFAKNGVLVGTFAVQCIALVSNILLSPGFQQHRHLDRHFRHFRKIAGHR